MMSLHRFFTFFLLLTITGFAEGQTNIGKVIPNNVFTAIKKSKVSFNDINQEAIYFSTLIPKKIVIEELERLYNELGSFEKDKKIAVNEAVDSYKLSLDEVTVEKNSLKTLLDYVRKEHAEEIKMYKENKKKLSTKMVGESLEESCRFM